MADQRDETRQPTQQGDRSQRDQRQQSKDPLNDLDTSADEAEKVKGGARRKMSSDPCEGGE